MLMVIFGAGASYDSCPTYPPGTPVPGTGEHGTLNEWYRPPLAKDLFANRSMFIQALDAFPQCKAIVPRLRDPVVRRGEASIETRLQEIEEEAKTYDRGPFELEAVRRYLQRAISQCEIGWRGNTKRITNQLWLLREIQRIHKPTNAEPTCLVTFNYDTLLEDALADLGLEVKHMDGFAFSSFTAQSTGAMYSRIASQAQSFSPATNSYFAIPQPCARPISATLYSPQLPSRSRKRTYLNAPST